MDFRVFLSELKKRNVVRVAGVYTVTAWGGFQVARTIFETLDLPKWISALTLMLLVLGLPIAALGSWAFELGPDGSIRRTSAAAADAPKRPLNWMDWGALAAIVAVAVVLVVTTVGLVGTFGQGGGSGLQMAASSKSVAVLPFASFSAAGDSDYFADGLTEEVTNSLAQVPDLKVAGRTSAFYFKGKNEDVREIGKKLNVAHVVEGSVRRSGDKLRVTCQLISVKNGFHLWSETYDRTMDDAFAIQSEIADGVAEALKAELHAGGVDDRRARRDPEAYRLEVVAKGQVRRKGKEQLQSAQAIYKRLIEMEPENAQVRASYAYTTAYLAQNYQEGDYHQSVHDAEAQIAKALELDPQSSQAYVAKGMLNAIQFVREGEPRFDVAAEAAYRRAVELAPRDPEALSLLGDSISQSKPAEAVTYLRRALEVDPLDRVANNALAGSLVATNHLDEAEQRYRANVGLFPEFVDSKEQLAALMLERGKLDEAAIWYRLAAAPQTDPAASIALSNVYYNLEMPTEAQAALAGWRSHPVVGAVAEAIRMIVASDYQGLLSFSQGKLSPTEPDPLWQSGVVQGAAMLGKFDLAREQLVAMSPQMFEPEPKVAPQLANDAAGAAYIIEQTGDWGQSRRILQALLRSTEPTPGRRQPHARRIARLKAYVMLGDKEAGLAELRGAIDNGYRQLYDMDTFTRLDRFPMLQPLRNDPRFQGMIREVQADNVRMRGALLARTAPPPSPGAVRTTRTAN